MRRRTVVGSVKHAPIHLIPEVAQPADEPAEREPAPIRARRVVLEQRAPVLKLAHVLEDDHARANLRSPGTREPRKPADLLLDGLRTLGPAEVPAIGREPKQL